MANINTARVVLAGIVAGIVMLVVGTVIGMLTGHMYTGAIWKPMAGASWFVWLLVHNIFFGLVFTVLYAVFANVLKASMALKGFVFGFVIWLFSLQGLSMTFLSMTVSLNLIFLWAVQGLISYVLAGLVIAYLYKE